MSASRSRRTSTTPSNPASRAWRRIAPAAIAVPLVAACSPAGDTPAEGPNLVYGINYSHQLGAMDLTLASSVGRVLAVVPEDLALVVLISASRARLEQLPGIMSPVCSLGSDSTAVLEVEISVAPASVDSGVAILERANGTRVNASDGWAEAHVTVSRITQVTTNRLVHRVEVQFCPQTIAHTAQDR